MLDGLFHPLIESWFLARFGGPTEPQRLGWPHIAAGRNTLIAAPTGSGKTLAAFLVCLDRLFRRWLAGDLIDAVDAVYVSPLKALSNDIRRNLEVPLAELAELAVERGLGAPPIRTAVRTGDTPAAERTAMLRRPPHILVTTPESLFIVLTSPKARQKLIHSQTVIVDEIHALARDKRGSHLALTLERLDALCQTRPTRIGLSATQRPIDDIAGFLIGVDHDDWVGCSVCTEAIALNQAPAANPPAAQQRLWKEPAASVPAPSPPDEPRTTVANGSRRCVVIDTGHIRTLDLDLEVPPLELEAVSSGNHWGQIYGRLVELIRAHHSTLVFVNTRRMAERIAHNLTEILGADAVASHHGSLSRELRHTAEQRLKDGTLRAIVATASLEMGIDVGYIDLVCQIGSPRAIATFVQRVGRSGHSLGALPKGRLFPLTRDELIECLALLKAVFRGELDRIEIPECPLDILAQQITAAVACDEWVEDDLYALCRRAWPFRHLSRQHFDDIVQMLHQGIAPNQRRGAQIFRDQIGRRLRPRRGARLAAVTSGGAIPEQALFRVVEEPEGTFVGTVEEDFAVESYLGDIFLLGNTSWRIKSIRGGELVVEDAHGAPPSIPFWLGEAPGRTVELSSEVSRLRKEIADRIGADPHNVAEPSQWLSAETRCLPYAAEQAVRYVAAQVAAVGVIPAVERIVLERFFDESGGMQVVIHAPLGSRINRAWGLTLRKRFCRSFDFELQASADDDGIVLSVGPQHSFPLEDLGRMLNPGNAQYLLEQALLAAPMFKTRWRWNATRALAVLRHEKGNKVPPYLQRFRADDLLAAVFPACAGCFENHHGDMPIPDHPLIRQTVYDCLHEAMDIDGFLRVLGDVEAGKIEMVARDTREPSPFCYELLNASPYAFLDPAPAEERRTRAVGMRRGLSLESLQDLGRLDPDAIAQVREEAWPTVRSADELHDALMSLVVATEVEAAPWRQWFEEHIQTGRATRVHASNNRVLSIAAERWPIIAAAYTVPGAATVADPEVVLPPELTAPVARTDAYVEIARGRIQHAGPTTAAALAFAIGLDADLMFASLEAVEASGMVLRGHFTIAAGPNGSSATPDQLEWCDRRLLARIHRLTLEGLRRRIEPVSPTDYLRFLSRHHRVLPADHRHGPAGVKQAVTQLQGFESPAAVWESQLVAGRVAQYDPQWLDQLFMTGDLVWGRLRPPASRRVEPGGPASVPPAPPVGRALTRAVPISLATRADLGWLLPNPRDTAEQAARGNAQLILEALRCHGALFWQELQAATDLLPGHLDEALRELAALGLVTSDGYAAVRAIAGRLVPKLELGNERKRRRQRKALRTSGPAGRWSLFPGLVKPPAREEYLARWCMQLLARYGVVFRDVLARESAAPPWSELAPVLRQLERRGEIRGGRFIAQVAGEQFAAEETVEQLRQVRDLPATEPWIVLSAADPLNLLGILSPGGRLPATHGGTLVLEAGRYLAARSGDRIEYFTDLPAEKQAEMTRALLRGHRPPPDHEDAAAKRFADRLAQRREAKAANRRQAISRGDVPKPTVFPSP